MSPEPLPKFDIPPVSEVVLSVQFDPLPQLTPIHLGHWWTPEQRQRYPVAEERSALPTITESFDRRSRQPGLSLEVVSGPPSPAMWFLKADRSELLQIQRDRFTRNWTRIPGSDGYPSYAALRPAFERDYIDFCEFLSAQELGTPNPTQCEITYINPLPAGDTGQPHGDPAALLAPWTAAYSEPWQGEIENLAVHAQYIIPSDDGQPAGRLHVDVQPVVENQSGVPVYLAQLVARGRPLAPGTAGVMAFLDLGHRWIVQGFTSWTTVPMHSKWRRTN